MTIKIEDFEKMDIKVGEIISAEEVAGADRLYKLEVDIGKKQITLVAGIKKHYEKQNLAGKRIIVLTNLQPTMIRGITSEGMLLAAVDGDDLSLLTVDSSIKIGSDVA